MRAASLVCTVLAMGPAASSWADEATEYLLLPMSVEVSPKARANVLEPPQPVHFQVDDCGITANLGAGGEADPGAKSEHYSGTAYSSELKLEGSGQVSGFVMAHPIKAGGALSGFRVMEDGQTCTETIDGKIRVFKKYSASWRQ